MASQVGSANTPPAFNDAASQVKNLVTRPDDQELLELYGLYKQGVVGDNTTDRPGMFDLKGKAKWNAWNVRKGMSKEAAQTAYIEFVNSLVKKYGLKQ